MAEPQSKTFGELIPLAGGDAIPLLKSELLIGRRESCDIVLRFANVSAHHCQLAVTDGYWRVKDLDSRNGIKINGLRLTDGCLKSGDILTVGSKHDYEIKYSPTELGAVGPPPFDGPSDIFDKPLLERAGLSKRRPPTNKEQ